MQRFLTSAVLFAATTLLFDAPVFAQRGAGFGYGPGLGGFYSNYMVPGYPYYGNGKPSFYYGRGYGNSNPSSSSNRYSYRPRTVTVAPQPTRVYDGGPIKIAAPADAGTPLTYSINGTSHVLQPGESQWLTHDRQWIIRFDRGGNYGQEEYGLTPGTYTFEPTKDRGWELFHDDDLSKLAQANAGAPGKNRLPPPTK